MSKRKIINIDDEKCTGCGLCIPNCPEGAIRIIDGKARLISDLFCDGLGACLGHCPEGAITIGEREAVKYDEKAVMRNLAKHAHEHEGCPGSKIVELKKPGEAKKAKECSGASLEPQLTNWPVQIKLVSPQAPYFKDADLLIAADCVPFAYAGFHENFLKGKVLIIGCPKLDDTETYKAKISSIIVDNSIRSVTHVHMEVPCCFGMMDIIKEAIAASGKSVPFNEVVIGIKGGILK